MPKQAVYFRAFECLSIPGKYSEFTYTRWTYLRFGRWGQRAWPMLQAVKYTEHKPILSCLPKPGCPTGRNTWTTSLGQRQGAQLQPCGWDTAPVAAAPRSLGYFCFYSTMAQPPGETQRRWAQDLPQLHAETHTHIHPQQHFQASLDGKARAWLAPPATCMF